jgi:aminopeptidase
MKKSLAPLCGLAVLLGACAAPTQNGAPAAKLNSDPAPAAATTKKAPPTDLEQLAERLVNQSAAVKEGEIVLINGGVQDLELLENIAVHVRKAGGFPLVEVGSDRLARRLYADVPEKYDAQQDALGMKMAETLNVVISVDSNLAEGLFADADPKRLAARARASQPVGELFEKRNVRTVEVGNSLYPTPWRAARYGFSEADLTKTFWEGVNIDYTSLQARGEQVKAALAAGNELHVTSPNGTDLKVKIGGRPVFVSDGIISEEDKRKGAAAVQVYLPAGEVFAAPVEGTAEGKVVVARQFFEGKEIQNLTLTFAAGKLTSLAGSGPGFELLKARYDAAGEGKDIFAVVDLGINPNVRLPQTSGLGTWVPAGTITVGVGDNTWAGGANRVPFGYFVSLPGTTVTLDGKPIIEAGQLKI